MTKLQGGRRKAREFALQGLYQWRVAGNPLAAITEQAREAKGFARADSAHFDALLGGCIAQSAELGKTFEPFLDRRIEGLSPIEYGCLLIGAYELANCPEIPYRVVINEAVELAKSYGGTEGYKYVNGVLDKVAGVLRPGEAVPREAATPPRKPAARPRTARSPLGTSRTPRRRTP